MYKTLFVSVLFFAVVHNARAYLDPGTGSFIIQMLVATIAGAAFGLKIFWKRVQQAFSGIFLKKTTKIEAQKEVQNDEVEEIYKSKK